MWKWHREMSVESKSPTWRWNRGGSGEEGRFKGVPQSSSKLNSPCSHAGLRVNSSDMTTLMAWTLDRREEESRSQDSMSAEELLQTHLLCPLPNECLDSFTLVV